MSFTSQTAGFSLLRVMFYHIHHYLIDHWFIHYCFFFYCFFTWRYNGFLYNGRLFRLWYFFLFVTDSSASVASGISSFFTAGLSSSGIASTVSIITSSLRGQFLLFSFRSPLQSVLPRSLQLLPAPVPWLLQLISALGVLEWLFIFPNPVMSRSRVPTYRFCQAFSTACVFRFLYSASCCRPTFCRFSIASSIARVPVSFHPDTFAWPRAVYGISLP